MQFSTLLNNIQRNEGEASLVVPEDWMQGRSVFGGLQTVLALQAMRGLIDKAVPLRTLQTTFIAPPSSSLLKAKASILRQGKSAIHVEARLFDGDQLLAVVMGVFGSARSSAIALEPQRPAISGDQGVEFRYLPGLTPSFTKHFSAKWLRGGLPYTGNPLPEAIIEVSMPGEDASSENHAVAIADFIPPVALSMLSAPAPGSSMTWMIEFLSDELQGLPMHDWRVDAEMVAAKDGYTSQSVMLWGPHGQPVALSRQSMVVFG